MFSVLGCADPALPKWAKLQRKGDKATVICDNEGTKWEMICHGTKWSVGTFNNCSAGKRQV